MKREDYLGLRTKPDPEKYCAFCGKRMHRQRFASGRLEDLAAFNRRKYCCKECANKGLVMIGKNEQDYSSSHHSARKIKYLIEEREYRCDRCGSTDNIDVHHIDGDNTNNDPMNLMLLCRRCHMKEHRPSKTCKICGKIADGGLGYCNKHYIRYKKYGDPLHTPWSEYKEKASKGPILQYTKDGTLVATYKDLRSAAEQTSLPRSSITAACNGNRKTFNGYIWKYGNEND